MEGQTDERRTKSYQKRLLDSVRFCFVWLCLVSFCADFLIAIYLYPDEKYICQWLTNDEDPKGYFEWQIHSLIIIYR